jgi:hypothetical protein
VTSATPATAIRARLEANWHTTPIVFENETFEWPHESDATPKAFVALEFPGGSGQQWTIGNPGANAWREDGAFLLHVLVPTGSGAKVGRQYADDLAALFRGQSFGGVTCWESGPPRATEPPNGNYFRLTIATRFHYEFLG